MSKRKSVLLVIDGQNDFMDLPNSALPVAGATKDMDRVVAFIGKNIKGLDEVSCTLDSHHSIAIFHPCWFKDKDSNFIKPFTAVFPDDLKGTYTPQFAPAWTNEYVGKLTTQGEKVHLIWPYHCLIGTEGHALYAPLAGALSDFEATKGVVVNYVTKGANPYVEHFGAFRANVEMPQAPDTQLNQRLINYLMAFDDIYLTGEARSHCVSDTLKQAVNEVPGLAHKIIVLEDCTSDVPGSPAPGLPTFGELATPGYEDAKSKGVRFAKSIDIVL